MTATGAKRSAPNASEWVRNGLRIIEARECRLAELDRALHTGLPKEVAGALISHDTLMNELKQRYTRMAAERSE
ncbi:type II toxin-antitoxin system ParD family antitoxin [Asticcacaulis sp. W401b]|uniref:type II toxin-antitoxin system ParD family antitoxin n=1 Tax=Asticcacaulis sp. W401b TaxID=3388666 RepID=UPI0039708A80